MNIRTLLLQNIKNVRVVEEFNGVILEILLGFDFVTSIFTILDSV